MLEIEFDLATGEKSYLCPEGSYTPVTDSVINFQDINRCCPEGANMITENICQATGCNGIIHAKSLCHKHYLQVKRHGKIFERTQYDPNEITTDRNITYIQLYNKQNEPVSKAIIDTEDINRVKEHRWGRDGKGYVKNQKGMLLHRFLMKSKIDDMLDHINQDKLDNRKSNLRLTTLSENGFNSKLPSNNTSGVKGVYRHKQSRGYEACLEVNSKRLRKLFRTFEEAVNFRTELERNEPTFFNQNYKEE